MNEVQSWLLSSIKGRWCDHKKFLSRYGMLLYYYYTGNEGQR